MTFAISCIIQSLLWLGRDKTGSKYIYSSRDWVQSDTVS